MLINAVVKIIAKQFKLDKLIDYMDKPNDADKKIEALEKKVKKFEGKLKKLSKLI
tara:strand:- start:1222 stop:1386 length:165 start_codon:yes stop_codon:yes gene_type:complete